MTTTVSFAPETIAYLKAQGISVGTEAKPADVVMSSNKKATTVIIGGIEAAVVIEGDKPFVGQKFKMISGKSIVVSAPPAPTAARATSGCAPVAGAGGLSRKL